MFDKKQQREHKIVDLAALPPCRQVVIYHIQRSNYIAYLWRQSDIAMITQPSLENHGWTPNGEIHWMDTAYPYSIEDMLFDENEGENENSDDGESENEDDGDFYGSDAESEEETDI